jgi:hypothetical protein
MPRHTRSDNDDTNALAHAVEALRIELAGLRDAIDELREEIQWGNRNCKGYNPKLFRFNCGIEDCRETPETTAIVHGPAMPDECREEPAPRRQVNLW